MVCWANEGRNLREGNVGIVVDDLGGGDGKVEEERGGMRDLN